MNLHCHLLAYLLLQEPQQLPLGKPEYLGIVGLETAIIWVLWKALVAKDKMLDDLLREQMLFLGKGQSVLERIERFLDSFKASAK